MTKTSTILEAIRTAAVGDDIILHNEDTSIWCILRVIAKEHEETREEGSITERGGV